MASESRRKRREQESRMASQKGIQERVVMKRISSEYHGFTKAVMDSYAERVNRFLSKASPELIAEIGYDHVVLDFQTQWKIPTPEARLKLEQLRKIRLDDDQECFFTSVVRRHYKRVDNPDPYPANEGKVVWDDDNNAYEKVEELRVWANMGYNFIDPETGVLAFESNKEIEISALASMIGFLTEKGIEYVEAERQTKKQVTAQQAKMDISKKVSDVDELFKQAINKKEAEGNLSEKLILDKEES